MKTSLVLLLGALGTGWGTPAHAAPVPFRAPERLPDVLQPLFPGDVHLDGWLGRRILINEKQRLLTVDLEPLLAGFRHRPGSHPWIGEHIGKWMHAAGFAWAYTGDPALRARLDYAAAELIKCQEQDGYLGTYVPEKRFGLYPGADWDVWSHKYNLMGLLTYYQFTGSPRALAACRKMGDLLIRTFGPGRKSIISAGTHVGMAATSVLEPVVLLYRFTNDPRYLDFALYIVRSWSEPGGPDILHSLLEGRPVNRTANGKAYEMLSNLVGLCELTRVTGNRDYLRAVLNAWDDIVTERLYITGSTSQSEHFHGDYELPNGESAHVAETCVSTTWVQLNLQLYRLTGEARFGDQLERTLYNHLAAAQHPAGNDWCYFTPLEGRKQYRSDINCCHSSGPRGMALAPRQAYLKTREGDADALVISTFEPSRVKVTLDGRTVRVRQESGFPRQGESTLRFQLDRPARFALRLRTPVWAQPLQLERNGQPLPTVWRAGWTVVPARAWRADDVVTLRFRLAGKLVAGEHGNAGRAALTWGPFVLAYDEARNPGGPRTRNVGLTAVANRPLCRVKPGSELMFEALIRTRRDATPRPAVFVPFADAGRDGGRYRVWLLAPDAEWPVNDSLLADGEESRSRRGNLDGSINDGDRASFVVTFDGHPASLDWYAVTLDRPVTIQRVVFAHGHCFHDGGWFDARTGKPRVQVRRRPDGPWETVGALEDYPATTATDSRGLRDGQPFTLRLPRPMSVVAVRVIGKPACGDNPRQAFSSCAELEAFPR